MEIFMVKKNDMIENFKAKANIWKVKGKIAFLLKKEKVPNSQYPWKISVSSG